VGCRECGATGFVGRLVLAEALPITAEVRRILQAGGGEEALAAAALRAGMRPLAAEGLRLVAAGETTAAEVARVLSLETVRPEKQGSS
jgi:general secretion pathway protein E